VNAIELMGKAERALTSAHTLLADGDDEGACNRAYYAMFNAARAALLASSAPLPASASRTHNGLITAFSLHLVKPGLVPVELGRSLNRAEELRLIADYTGDLLHFEQVHWLIGQAGEFVSFIRSAFIDKTP